MRYAKKERAVVYNQQVWLNDLNYHNTFQRYHPADCIQHNHILKVDLTQLETVCHMLKNQNIHANKMLLPYISMPIRVLIYKYYIYFYINLNEYGHPYCLTKVL